VRKWRPQEKQLRAARVEVRHWLGGFDRYWCLHCEQVQAISGIRIVQGNGLADYMLACADESCDGSPLDWHGTSEPVGPLSQFDDRSPFGKL
jgi:hypothetical protein